jgi:hypothetical protein
MELIDHVALEGARMTVRPARSLRRFVPYDLSFEYEDGLDLALVPQQVTMLPFLWTVAPIVWALGQEYELDVLDPRVAQSFEHMRAELRTMYPSLSWSGAIRPREVSTAPDSPLSELTHAALFSGGVDSTFTALRYQGKDQLLISVWGADVRLTDHDTWERIATRNEAFAARHGSAFATVRSNFKSINYPLLNTLAPDIPNWWREVQLSPGTLGLTAPLLYAKGIPIIRVASTLTAESAANYASLPRLDNLVSLATARVEHDGFELSRQAKIETLVDRQRRSGEPMTLRVCLTHVTKDGGNCGRCEKCLRTIVGLLIAGADPRDFGFPRYRPEQVEGIPAQFAARRLKLEGQGFMWTDLQAHTPPASVLDGPFWSWLRGFDFYAYRMSQRPNLVSWERVNPLIARMPRLVGAARSARRLLRRLEPRRAAKPRA